MHELITEHEGWSCMVFVEVDQNERPIIVHVGYLASYDMPRLAIERRFPSVHLPPDQVTFVVVRRERRARHTANELCDVVRKALWP